MKSAHEPTNIVRVQFVAKGKLAQQILKYAEERQIEVSTAARILAVEALDHREAV